MDTMSKGQFIRLHGSEIFERLAVPIIGDDEDDVFAIAAIHHRFIERFILEYPDDEKRAIGLPQLVERVSFLEFMKRFIDCYGQAKGDELYELTKKKFDLWLSKFLLQNRDS